MKKLGLIINPVAGIGGKVGLKGSDGIETYRQAIRLGATPESGTKALVALTGLQDVASSVEFFTFPGEMGADLCESCGLNYHVIGTIKCSSTTPEDTINAARLLVDQGIDLLVFAGGDGTARNILDAVGDDFPVIGIPTGCKIHSGVYAVNPRIAGNLLRKFICGEVYGTKKAEVMDINEDLFRQGCVQARLYGYLTIPNEKQMVQNMKSGRGLSETATIDLLSNYLADSWENDTLYIVGTGSTTAAIMGKLGLENTLLGVDLVYNRKVIATDCTEKEILETIANYPKVKIIVTVIGGQGYIFGRGNQQISAAVIEKVGKGNIIVAAAKNKIMSLFGQPLYVDTGLERINQYLKGYIRVIVGYEDYIMMRVEA